MNSKQLDVVQRQALLYGNPTIAKEGLKSSSIIKKVQNQKPKKKIRVKVASDNRTNPQEPRNPLPNRAPNNREHSTNRVPGTTQGTSVESGTSSNQSNRGVEVQQQRREISSAKTSGYPTSRDRGKFQGQQVAKDTTHPKVESDNSKNTRSNQKPSPEVRIKPTNKRSILSQRSGHQHIQHQQRTEESQRAAPQQSSRESFSHQQLPSQKSGSDHPERLSNSSFESKKSTSSRSRSRNRRLGFDGAIKMSTPPNLENCQRGRQLHSDSEVAQQRQLVGTTTYNMSSTSNDTVENQRPSSHLNQSPAAPNQQSASINRNQRQGNATAITFASTGSNIEKMNMETMHPHHAHDGVERAIEVPNVNAQSSRCTSGGKVTWGIVCCIIVVAAIVVPCVLLLVDFSGNDMAKLSGAKGIIANIPNDICNESVPKSGDCTFIDSNNERQGGELCNLVAKSMINTTVYADVALINAGICKETLFAPEITAGNAKKAIDSESLVVVEISGADLIDVLNGALTSSFGDSANPLAYPYAAGMRYNVEANLPPSERLSQVEVNRNLRTNEWAPIDIRRFYKVVTTESLASGGMGYEPFDNIIDDWKEPLNVKTGDAFYNFVMKYSNDANWSEIPNSEYSTQYFIQESEEITMALVPSRICHATIPGQPVTSVCTAADVAKGSEVCNLLSWMIYDQNFGVDIVLLKGNVCAADIEEGKLVESSLDVILSENKSLWKVDMLGSEIRTMIYAGVAAGVVVSSGGELHYPYAAGLKFDVSTSPSPVISNVRILASGGNWITMLDTETYTVATTSDLLGNTESAQNMGTTLKEQITSYAEDWNVLYKTPTDKASTQSYA